MISTRRCCRETRRHTHVGFRCRKISYDRPFERKHELEVVND
jgi:hypothetical protein